MEQFTYVARGADGTIVNGFLSADSPIAARAALEEQYADILHLEESTVPAVSDYQYFSLVATLRIYCGWILALTLFSSLLWTHWQPSLLLDIACASFLFLLLTSLHKLLQGGVILGAILFTTGIAGIISFVMLA